MEALFIYGLTIGALLFLLALGLTLIFGLLDVINFAHGALYMLGAYIGYTFVTIIGNYWVTVLIVPLALAVIGGLIEIIALRPLYKKSILYQLLLTFGLTLIIHDLIKMFWGTNQLPFETPEIFYGAISIFDVLIPNYRIFVIVFVTFLVIAMGLFLQKTKVGILIRASSANRKMAAALGVDVKRVFTGTFALGTGLAGLSGIIAAVTFPVNPGMGAMVLVDCFIVVVLGGLGSFKGALLGALLIGEARAFGDYYLPEYASFVIYVLMGCVLLLRPRGLFGEMRVHK